MFEAGSVLTRLGFHVDDTGADRYEARLRKVRGEAKRDVTTHAGFKVDDRGVDRYNGRLKEVTHHHDDVVRSSAKVRTGFGTVWGAGGAAFAAAGGAYGLVKGVQAVVGAYSESQKVATQTNAVLKSTGEAANVSAKHVSDLAGALSKKTGIDDETIQSGENLLLTFRNIRNETGKGNDIFDQTTKVMNDMSVALGQDTKSSAIQLGKALNDPVKGVTALQRVGVSFTASQKDQIKSLEDSGHHMAAQKIILRELQKEFGGSAKAAGDTLPGALNKAKVAIGNVAESIGGRLAPFITKGANALADLINGGGKAGGVMTKLRGIVTTIGNVFGRVFGFVKQIVADNRKQLESIGHTAGQLGSAIAKAFGSIYNIAKKTFGSGSGFGGDIRAVIHVLSQFAAIVASVYAAVVKRALPGIVTAFKGLATIVRGVVRIIAGVLTLNFGKAWDGVKDIFRGAIRVVTGVLRAATAPFREIASRIGHAIGSAFSSAWDTAKRLFRSGVKAVISIVRGAIDDAKKAGAAIGKGVLHALDFVSDLPGKLWRFLKDGLGKLGDFERAAASKAADAGKSMVSSVVHFLSDLPGKLLHIGTDAAQKLASGIGKLPGLLKNALSAAAGIAADVGRAIANWVNDHTLFGNHIHIGLPGPVPDINFTLPRLAKGAKVGPGTGGARLFIAGEGNADEWVISQEGDKQKNVAWAIEALQTLTGKRVELNRTGRRAKKRRRAPHFASASQVAGNQPGRADDAVANIERDMNRLDRQYGQLERQQNLTDEVFVVEDANGAHVDQDAVKQRAGEIDALIGFKRDKIRAKIEQYQKTLKQAIQAYRAAIKRLTAAVRRASRRRGGGNAAESYRGKIDDYNARISELRDAGRDLDLDLGDVDLDIAELKGEKASVLGTTAPAADVPAPDTGGGASIDTGGGLVTTDPGSGAATPEQIAAAAAVELQNYRSAQADAFASFGSNFFRAGGVPNGGDAGLRFFGAYGAAGGGGLFGPAGAGGAGVTVNIEQNFAGGPPPHLWTDETVRRLSAAMS